MDYFSVHHFCNGAQAGEAIEAEETAPFGIVQQQLNDPFGARIRNEIRQVFIHTTSSAVPEFTTKA